jgi:hypothetical protein
MAKGVDIQTGRRLVALEVITYASDAIFSNFGGLAVPGGPSNGGDRFDLAGPSLST